MDNAKLPSRVARRAAALLLALVCTVVLVSCGKGSGGNEPAPVVETTWSESRVPLPDGREAVVMLDASSGYSCDYVTEEGDIMPYASVADANGDTVLAVFFIDQGEYELYTSLDCESDGEYNGLAWLCWKIEDSASWYAQVPDGSGWCVEVMDMGDVAAATEIVHGMLGVRVEGDAVSAATPESGTGDGGKLDSGSSAAIPSDTSTQPVPDTFATRKVGREGVGFVGVPEDWVEFTDVDNPGLAQWSDPSGTVIVTLNSFTFEEMDWENLAEEYGYEATAEDFAMALTSGRASELDGQDGVEVTDVHSATVGGKTAYEIDTKWSDGSYMTIFYVAGDRKAYYISVEGDSESVERMVFTVKSTFSEE